MSNLKETRYASERKDFKNVETKLPHNSDYPDSFRPRIDRLADLNKLADEIRSSPTAIVNLLVDVGLEVMERSKELIKKDVERKLKQLLK